MREIDRGDQTVNTEVVERVDTRWFQDRLADKRLSQRQLAARMNLDPAAVSLMLRGRRKMSAAEAAEIARYLGVEVDDVLHHAGVQIQTHATSYPYKPSDLGEPRYQAHGLLNKAPAAEGLKLTSEELEAVLNSSPFDGVLKHKIDDAVNLYVASRLGALDKGEAKKTWGLLKANLGDVSAKGEGVVTEMLDMPVPLSDGTVAQLRLPKRLTKADAERIAALVTAFAVEG